MAGLGGGIILLVAIVQFFTPTVAIPIHGGIQLVSNGSRAAMLRKHIAWRPVLLAAVLLFPASLFGVALATSVPDQVTRLAIGVFVLIVAWRPGLLKWRGAEGLPDRALIALGAISGFLNTTVGASGPVTSPFFKVVTASHISFVATAATAQVFAHTSKIAAFTLDDFAIADHAAVVGTGAIGVIAGSWVGTRMLGKVGEERLDLLFKMVLTGLAIRLLGQALINL